MSDEEDDYLSDKFLASLEAPSQTHPMPATPSAVESPSANLSPGESLGRKEEPVKPPSDDARMKNRGISSEQSSLGILLSLTSCRLGRIQGRKGLGLGNEQCLHLGGSSKAAKRLLKRMQQKKVETTTSELKPGMKAMASSWVHVPVGESEFDEGLGSGTDRAIAARLKEQMKADSLRPLKESNEDFVAMRDAVKGDAPKAEIVDDQIDFDQETVDAAKEYIQKNVQERLTLVLEYLRMKYFYCFWCGASYDDASDLETNCPGPDEDLH
ncbi:hypothetical protein RHS01_04470 [Rhizoctonia solani]|uniref:DUF4187 domain-containing protein n=1 Tax=Rhizoctonia solani TaxID=456999 RepID=A0A8H7ICM5_9AGAM|nr:hypothetical protein RHS01_04470 [Rhizoctonia solani]